jgi:hypothetical protein
LRSGIGFAGVTRSLRGHSSHASTVLDGVSMSGVGGDRSSGFRRRSRWRSESRPTSDSHDVDLEASIGFEARGRHGALGVVVGVSRTGPASLVLVICGGVSRGLVYHVPGALVTAISRSRRFVVVDADLDDFHAVLRADGTIELTARPDGRGERDL